MKSFKKLSAILGLGGTVAAIIFLIVVLVVLGPLLLLWGLDLMGIEVQYTFKTFLGAFLVLLAFRSVSRRDNTN